MPDNFEWLKDEENGWIDPDPQNKPMSLTARHRRFLIGAGLLLAFLTPIIVFSVIFFQQRIVETSDTVESELENTHLIMLEAVSSGDSDLIDSLLPNDDPQIRESLLNQIDRHLLIDRKPLGLVSEFKADDHNFSQIITVTTSPDFAYAEVKSILPYRVTSLDEPNNLVELILTLAYKREGERWVSTILEDESDYWGEWVKLDEDLLTLTVPSLDAGIAQEMLSPLNQLSENICSTPDIDCPSVFHLEVHFDRQQESINRLSDAYPHINIFPFRERYFLSLPAPTIVGRPMDSAGQEALYRGYAAWLTTSLVSTYADLPENEVDGLMTALLDSNGLAYPPRPHPVLPRIPADLRTSTADLPSEDLLLLCSNRSAINLLRLDLESAAWSDDWNTLSLPIESVPPIHTAYVTAAPEHQGVLINISSFDEGQPLWLSYWWHDSNMLLLIDDVESYDVYPPTYQKDINRIGRFIRVVTDDQSGGIRELTTSWFDLGQCLAGPCQIQRAPGYPIWSPDGNHTLAVMLNRDGQLSILRGDKDGQPAEYLGLGSSPFWINDSTFGYVRPTQVTLDGRIVDDAGQEIAVGQIPEDPGMIAAIHQIVHTKFLQEALPSDAQPKQLQILSVMPDPQKPQQWIIAASSSPDIPAEDSYLFAMDIDSQELMLIQDLGTEKLHLPLFHSPDGRYLAFITSRDKDITFYIRDYISGRTTKSDHAFPVDWTDDGRWLLFFESEKMVLLSTETDREIEIPTNIDGCNSAVFTSEGK